MPNPSPKYDWQTKHLYLIIADEDYLAARALALMGMPRPAGVLAEQAVEKYIKLNFMEKNFIVHRIKPPHDIQQLFKLLKTASVKVGDFKYHSEILKRLYESFEYKYFDDQSLKGILQKKGRISIGLGMSHLDQFDELCMELRNNNNCDSGATPVYKAAQLGKPWFDRDDINLAYAFHTKNKFSKSFKINRLARG